VGALYLLLLAGFAAGIWAAYRATFPAAGLYRMTGVFQQRAGETLIVVSHEGVPGLMGEMADMVLEAQSKALLDEAGLAPGVRARFTVRREGERLVVVEIQVVR
jgi:hypothetical protein